MRMDGEQARERFTEARVAHLATADNHGRPHVVPVTFVVDGQALVFAVDDKPKTTTALHRLRNIAQNPQVSVLVDGYDEDWDRLWWARADGLAVILHSGDERSHAIELLCAKYDQYRERPPSDAVVRIEVRRWSGWSA